MQSPIKGLAQNLNSIALEILASSLLLSLLPSSMNYSCINPHIQQMCQASLGTGGQDSEQKRKNKSLPSWTLHSFGFYGAYTLMKEWGIRFGSPRSHKNVVIKKKRWWLKDRHVGGGKESLEEGKPTPVLQGWGTKWFATAMKPRSGHRRRWARTAPGSEWPKRKEWPWRWRFVVLVVCCLPWTDRKVGRGSRWGWWVLGCEMSYVQFWRWCLCRDEKKSGWKGLTLQVTI